MSSKPKRPGSAFLLFSNEMRQSYKEQHPNASVTQISSGLGEMWQSLTENEKKKYNDMYAGKKEAYEKTLAKYMANRTADDIATDEKEKNKARAKKGGKVKKVKDPTMPKRPLSAYMFYTQAIRKSLPQMSVTDQAKSLGASWKQLTESDKQKYETLAEADRKRYQKEKEQSGH